MIAACKARALAMGGGQQAVQLTLYLCISCTQAWGTVAGMLAVLALVHVLVFSHHMQRSLAAWVGGAL